MQPPPRKGSSVKFLKNLHAEQIAKLQVKNQTECELLEDLRSFIIKKSALEKSYCEALLKITSVYLNKKITTSIPDLKTEGSDERWNMWSVWRTVLEENEKLSKARLAAIEVFLQQIADDAKVLRMHKLQTTKKCVDLLASIQKEVQNTVQDVEKTRKVYFDEEHCAHDVRDKAKDIEARLKRKKGSFFQSLSTLQKSSAKVSLKREQMDDKSVGARNDYLLSLATANSHQTRYFVHDLQNIMQTMESNVYEKVQEYFTLIGRAELLTCAATQASYSKIKEQAQKLTREYNLQCLYLYYPVLKQHIQYEFEACDGDTIDYITSGSSSTALQFVEEVKDWLETIAREKRAIQTNSRKLQTLIMLRENGEKSDPADPNGPDLDTKIDDLQEAIRKSEVMKVKTEAKIELLKKSCDENVRDMYKKLEEELGSVSDLEEEKEKLEDVQRLSFTESISRRVDEQSYSSDEESASVKVVTKNISTDEDSGAVSNAYAAYKAPEQSEDVFKQLEANWDTAEEPAVSATMLPELSSDNIYRPEDDIIPNISYDEFDTPFKCVVLYNYTAQNPDELTIVAGEELDILGEGDGDGWLRARNSVGQEGFVPCTYLESFTGGEEDLGEHDEEVMTTGSGSHLTSQISFSSVDYTVNTSNIGSTTAGADSVVSGDSSASVITALHDLETDKINEDFDRRVHKVADDSEYCIALYDYESNGDDELTFQEGQVIRVLRKIVHNGIDDGWWEGELDGRIGLFPSLMVEECSAEGRSLYFDDEFGGEPVSAPPLFTPPEVPDYLLGENHINEQGFTADEPVNEVAKTVEKFSFEMSDNQQKHYNTQFEEQITNECPNVEESRNIVFNNRRRCSGM